MTQHVNEGWSALHQHGWVAASEDGTPAGCILTPFL